MPPGPIASGSHSGSGTMPAAGWPPARIHLYRRPPPSARASCTHWCHPRARFARASELAAFSSASAAAISACK
eukprot:9268828-Lingulodinium_polyedra.AAC.1